jgi:hypothetical protein
LVLEWSTGFLATLMALVLWHMRGTWEHSSPKSLSMYVIDPKQLWATTSSSNILNFYGRLGYTRLFSRRPQNKQRIQKPACPRSRPLINSTPLKVGIQKTKKWKGRGRRVPKTELRSVSKIPEDPLGGLPMSVTPENERTDTHGTRCPASSPSSTRGSRSCSSTPSRPRALCPCLHRAL